MKEFLLSFISLFTSSNPQLCSDWKEHRVLGNLNTKIINEASGLIVSKYKNRLYHVNDSGDGPFLYQTNLKGELTNKIELTNVKVKDVESLGYGNCESGKCIFIADIGDNKKKRKEVSIHIIKERENFPKKVKVFKTIRIQYPDKPHNAEAIAIHPNGNIYLLTKEFKSSKRKAYPSKVYLLKKEDWQRDNYKKKKLKYLGSIDIPKLLKKNKYHEQIITGLDISSDGNKILISTYKNAIEVALNIGDNFIPETKNLKLGVNVNIIPLKPLAQIEAISYLNSSEFIYTTESDNKTKPSPIISAKCSIN
jgi:hypothetical protein